jgi:hypothetical protein
MFFILPYPLVETSPQFEKFPRLPAGFFLSDRKHNAYRAWAHFLGKAVTRFRAGKSDIYLVSLLSCSYVDKLLWREECFGSGYG